MNFHLGLVCACLLTLANVHNTKSDTCDSMCSSIEGCPLVKNTLMKTLAKLDKEFFLSFEYKATAYGGDYQSVIHFTENGDCCDVGKRIPGVWTHDGGRLHLSFSIDGNGNSYIDTEKYPVGQWHQAEFSQRLENGKYIYRVNINGKNVVEVENKDPRVFSNVRVYAANPWHESMEGSIRNLFINKDSPNKCGGSYETKMLIQLDISTAFETAKLSSTQKETCTEEMKKTIKNCKETEDIIKKLRFKKPFIRSTPLTDRLGSDSRLFTALKQTIKRISRDWTPNGAAEKLIQILLEKFQKWGKKGGGLSILKTRPESEDAGDGDLVCSADLQYRRIDGKCNNLAVTDQGSEGIAMRRFMSNKYEDGVSIPRGGLTNPSLPSARVVSRKIHHSSNPNPLTDKGYTLMAMQFGQFLDHDVTLTADMELHCCDPEILSNNPSFCFNIDITGDDFYSGKTTCHSFTRSVQIVSDTGVREQINGITAYIDASNVYGSNDSLAKNLRTLNNGRLKTHDDGPTLPTRNKTNLESEGPAQLDEDLVAGDMRAIEQPTLASIHSLFLNEHNRIADELRSRLSNFLSNKKTSEQDEIIYQESRKLVGAEMQNIVYNEFLPIVLGQEQLTKHNLQLSEVTTYDDQIDASIRNEFATVAFRFGHSLIAGMFNGNGGHRLKLTYFDETAEFVSGKSPNNNGRAWYSELTETSNQTSPAQDVFCTEDVTNFLFSNTRGGETNFGEDLPARNIQRGRDHGLPDYNEFRTFCGLSPLKDFHNKPEEITTANWAKLKNTYNRVTDIDAWTGGLAEKAPSDGLVGPTFACIIGKQFNLLKFGDRFFFNNDNGNGLKVKSRETIAKRNLGDIICDNTDTDILQTYVMIKADANSNPQQKCSSRNSLDFSAIAMDITDEVCATLFEHGDFVGKSFDLYTNKPISNLVDSGWNDRISSMRVMKGSIVHAFEHTNFEGEKLEITSDTNIVNPNDWISSLRCTKPVCSIGEEYEGNCYLYVPTSKTWLNAEVDCNKRKGTLASINNAGANNFLTNLARGTLTWIGASDKETEGVWKWTNGDVVKFTDWYPGEPNNSEGKANCAAINWFHSIKWDDRFCSDLLPYICQLPKCCEALKISAPGTSVDFLSGTWNYVKDYEGAPAYIFNQYYLFYYQNRWIVEPSLGYEGSDHFFGYLRFEGSFQCPENVGPHWKHVYDQSKVEEKISVKCEE